MNRARVLLTGVLACAALMAWGGSVALGDFSSGSFSYSDGDPNNSQVGCTNHVDPIGIVWYGANANSSRARSLVQSEMGWGGDGGAGGQYGKSHGYCTVMDGQSYSACGNCDRNHVRFNQTHHADTLGRLETVGTPHHEIWYPCGHSVDSYNYAKYLIIGQMSYHWGVSYQYWGNTEAELQCAGYRVGGDGQVGWINIG